MNFEGRITCQIQDVWFRFILYIKPLEETPNIGQMTKLSKWRMGVLFGHFSKAIYWKPKLSKTGRVSLTWRRKTYQMQVVISWFVIKGSWFVVKALSCFVITTYLCTKWIHWSQMKARTPLRTYKDVSVEEYSCHEYGKPMQLNTGLRFVHLWCKMIRLISRISPLHSLNT